MPKFTKNYSKQIKVKIHNVQQRRNLTIKKRILDLFCR
ncbi:MAG: hypothetical protein ACJAQ1_001504, partial [Flavobacterium sp.]